MRHRLLYHGSRICHARRAGANGAVAQTLPRFRPSLEPRETSWRLEFDPMSPASVKTLRVPTAGASAVFPQAAHIEKTKRWYAASPENTIKEVREKKDER